LDVAGYRVVWRIVAMNLIFMERATRFLISGNRKKVFIYEE